MKIIEGQLAVMAARLGAAKRTGRKGDTNVVEVEDAVALSLANAHSLGEAVDGIYAYPRRFTSPPFQHQRQTMAVGLVELMAHKRLFNLSDPGLGKSYSTIWMIDVMLKLGIINSVLILAPKSTIYDPWRKEIFEAMPNYTVGLPVGNKAKREKEIARGYQIVITNHHTVSTSLSALKAREFDLIILDESTIIKTANAKITKDMVALVGTAKYVVLLSGTPTAHSCLDAHGQLLVGKVPNITRSLTKFKTELGVQMGPYKWEPFHDARDRVMTMMQPAVRFDKRECLDLPPYIPVFRDVGISKEQKYAHDMLVDEAVYELQAKGADVSHTVTAVNAMSLMTKLLQVSAGVVWGEDDKGKRVAIELDCKERIADVISIIESCEHKIVISATYTSIINMLYRKLEKHFGEDTVGIINGEVEAKARGEVVRKFQDPESQMRILLIHPKAAGHGITLTQADTLIHWTPPMSTEVYLQSCARIDRPGAVGISTTIIHMIGIPLERERYLAMADKVDDQKQMLDAYTKLMKQHGITVRIG